MKKILTLIAFCLTEILFISAQNTLTFNINAAGMDAAIDDYNPAQNNANEIEYNTCAWTISGTPVKWRNLFKFDLRCIPPNAIVTNAGLNLYYADTNSYGNALHQSLTSSNESVLFQVTSPWKENNVTWNNQPPVSSQDSVLLAPSISGTQNYLNIDVRQLVQKMVSNPNANMGLMLKLAQENFYSRLIFASGDHPNPILHPSLEVTYTIPESDCINFHLDEINEDAAIDDYVPGRTNADEIEYNTCAWTISGVPVIWRNLFKFDLPCGLEHATVLSANLSLYYAATNTYGNAPHESLTNSNESVLQRVLSPWSEDSLNWNNQPSTTSIDQVILPQSTSGNQDYLSIDVSNLIRGMQANTNQNFGFLLKLLNENQYARLIFASGDHPDPGKHPVLEVCYSIQTSIQINKDEIVSNIFPNPFQNKLSIVLKNDIHNSEFTIINAYGQLVYFKNNLSGKRIDLSDLNLDNGLYYYKISDKNGFVASGKILKQE